ncbi:LLM class F420-dependent oxidoreductase [Streptomyces brasiliensis]|uniref:LLM class F420-dependent oxidoreductase n=1 Tax=Streptomyces brasiliensis TaxID=1954 RepID=A0A917L5Q4_9ACTN|nr:LLM class F420-dependent oxidoreductase [Streptomyces brasiliensis]GGJ40926.1 LLM class F420-dependent oxidoreductase [Streptomyces brasiliensis]
MSPRPLRGPGRTVGIWAGAFRLGDRALVAHAAAALEEMGYAALWYPGGLRRTFDTATVLLEATSRVVVATGIANIWANPPSESATEFARLDAAHPGRFLLGLGVSHGPMVERSGLGKYEKPLARMNGYLDELDASATPVPPEDRIIGAHGPRMLALCAERSLGTHPYLVTPEHTAEIRAAVGGHARVMPEQGVILDTDPASARATAREALAIYLGLPNYVNNWLRLGFTPDDIAGGGSDRLIDALVAWGTPEQIADRVRAHHDAGADHVCLQVLGAPGTLPLDAASTLAGALLE